MEIRLTILEELCTVTNSDKILTPGQGRMVIKKRRAHAEYDEQVMLCDWFWLSYPQYRIHLPVKPGQKHRRASLLICIPNGQNIGPIAGHRLSRAGLVPGAPDLLLAIPSGLYFGLFIEMKSAKGGVVSLEQKIVHEALRAQRYQIDVAKGYLEARKVIERYLKA